MNLAQYEAAVEAILFSVGDSVPVSTLASALEITEREAGLVVERLKDRYREENSGVQIIELEDAYQMCTKPSTYEYLIRVAKQPKKHVLTDVVLETLSIIAYKQPVTRAEIEGIRGVSCAHAVDRLLEYGLIRELGRLDAPGRPILFGTTEEFLRCFAVHSVDDLPEVSEEKLEEFREEASKEAEIQIRV